ncbi:MAG: hypothetical protein ACTSQ8_24935 [Candidatus Helarchaeota archaeon]
MKRLRKAKYSVSQYLLCDKSVASFHKKYLSYQTFRACGIF